MGTIYGVESSVIKKNVKHLLSLFTDGTSASTCGSCTLEFPDLIVIVLPILVK